VELGRPGEPLRVDVRRDLLVIELDGRETHEARFVEDRRRWNRIQELGLRLLVFTWEDIEHRPRRAVRSVRRLLADPVTQRTSR
jgi:very-short-patch-repair endonuclease